MNTKSYSIELDLMDLKMEDLKMDKEVKEVKELTTVYILGGAGFIGKHLIKKINKKYNVIVIDKVIPVELKEKYKNIEFHEFDILEDFDKLKDFDFTNTTVFHLASILGPELITPDSSEKDFQLNFKLYNFFRTQSLKRFIFTSSSEVYGDQSKMDENDQVSIDVSKEGARSLYALQKLTAENLFRQLPCEFIITRLFNIVGAGQRTDFVLPIFDSILKHNLQLLSEKQPFENFKKFVINGDGNQRRTFMSVTELSRAFEALITFTQEVDAPKDSRIINDTINMACIKNNFTIKEVVINYLSFFGVIIDNSLKILEEMDSSNEDKEYLINIRNNLKDLIEYNENGLVGQVSRNPLVFKLYKVLNKKPIKNMSKIIGEIFENKI